MKSLKIEGLRDSDFTHLFEGLDRREIIFWDLAKFENNKCTKIQNIKTYQGFGTPNSPGNTASIYHVNIP